MLHQPIQLDLNEMELERLIVRVGTFADGWDDMLPLLNSAAGLDRVLTAVARIIARQQGDADTFHGTCAFVREAYLFGPGGVARQWFRDALLDSPVVRALARAVSGPGLFRRSNAVYTIGQVHILPALPALYAAFNDRRETDPLLLPHLMLEIGWLEAGEGPAEARRERIESLISCRSYLSRWTLLERDGDLDILDRLAEDANPWVAAEARYRREHQRQTAGWAKGERRRAFKALTQPRVTFSAVEIRFGNSMAVRGAEDYTVAELHAFVEDMVSEGKHTA